MSRHRIPTAPARASAWATVAMRRSAALHRDRDFECIAAVTGQALQWYGPDAGK
ncbi:hypothetical protein STSP_11920 [Streptomyces jeddahensis]|uniref:Uncharacterized protein n=1 Tax=Streptomyces jeddahensis TaxID=1716141 RepID=A0A177HX07_9ACTN|nr:hypothetical protein STSP_11920 [Streptomyces jeddahensis]